MKNNVFSGEQALLDFTNPDNHPPLPLVELPSSLNPFRSKGIRVYLKLLSQLPLANVKSLPARQMLERAKDEGQLGQAHTIIENSSGNTVYSLTILGRLFGIHRTRAIVSHEVSAGKLSLLRFFGTEIQVNKEPICPDPRDTSSGIYLAKRKGEEKGYWNPGQYDNTANPDAHERWTGPQLWNQLQGEISLLCGGLGTTGTIVGTSRYLKKQNPSLKTIGVSRAPNNPVPGVRTKNLLREIAFDWQSVVDKQLSIGTKPAFKQSLDLCRMGLLVGPSSGFAVAGLFEALSHFSDSELDSLRTAQGEIHAVCLCPDTPFPYIEEYFEFLEPEHFPVIENEILLRTTTAATHTSTEKIEEIDCLNAFEALYNTASHDTHHRYELRDTIELIDVRSIQEYEHAHLFGARSMPLQQLTTTASSLSKEKTIYCMCQRGVRSRIAVEELRQLGYHAISIEGGFAEWSEKDLPRWKPEVCQLRH